MSLAASRPQCSSVGAYTRADIGLYLVNTKETQLASVAPGPAMDEADVIPAVPIVKMVPE